VVNLDFEARSMEYLELLLPVFAAIFVFAVVFFFLQQWWGFQSGHGDTMAAEECL
jgi:hypothetical protein